MILIVDDSGLLRLSNERALVKAGHNVISAEDGEEGDFSRVDPHPIARSVWSASGLPGAVEQRTMSCIRQRRQAGTHSIRFARNQRRLANNSGSCKRSGSYPILNSKPIG